MKFIIRTHSNDPKSKVLDLIEDNILLASIFPKKNGFDIISKFLKDCYLDDSDNLLDFIPKIKIILGKKELDESLESNLQNHYKELVKTFFLSGFVKGALDEREKTNRNPLHIFEKLWNED